jgi:hypothetical protein
LLDRQAIHDASSSSLAPNTVGTPTPTLQLLKRYGGYLPVGAEVVSEIADALAAMATGGRREAVRFQSAELSCGRNRLDISSMRVVRFDRTVVVREPA